MKSCIEITLSEMRIKIDQAIENRDSSLLTDIIKKYEKTETDIFSINEKSRFYYYLSNAHSELSENYSFIVRDDNLEKTIKYLLLAREYSKEIESDLKCSILTNLGNLFHCLGRFFEAIDLYQEALKVNRNFGMALGNLGITALSLARNSKDKFEIPDLIRLAYQNLNTSLKFTPAHARNSFKSKAIELEKHFKKEYLNDAHNQVNLGKSKLERSYRNWCSKYNLFLSIPNAFKSTSDFTDDIYPSKLITELELSHPFPLSIFNQIKQEFVSSRFMLFEAITIKKPHFSDRHVFQGEFGDYSLNSLAIEKLKTSFRTCYSIFDRVAYLLYRYFEIPEKELKPYKVEFSKLLIKTYDSKSGIILRAPFPEIVNNNIGLKAITWLSRDFRKFNESKHDPMSSLSSDLEKLSKVRNFLEHRFLKIVEYGGYSEDLNELQISRVDFEDLTIKLFKIIRNLIFYSSISINIEEAKKVEPEYVLNMKFVKKLDKLKY